MDISDNVNVFIYENSFEASSVISDHLCLRKDESTLFNIVQTLSHGQFPTPCLEFFSGGQLQKYSTTKILKRPGFFIQPPELGSRFQKFYI